MVDSRVRANFVSANNYASLHSSNFAVLDGDQSEALRGPGPPYTRNVAPYITTCALLAMVMLVLMFTTCCSAQQHWQVPVWTNHYNSQRTGSNMNEPFLKPSNVNPSQFGKIFERQVVGQVYAQVLYMPSVPTSRGTRNVVYVATMANHVYAFDADDPDENEPIWHRQLGPSCPLSDNIIGVNPNIENAENPYCRFQFTNIAVEIGILSTPVIDVETNTMYVVAMNKDSSNPYIYNHRLWALDVRTGENSAHITGGNIPAVIGADYPGTGKGSKGGRVTFLSQMHMQRPSLLLERGIIYIAFGSFCDSEPFHGWLLGYDSKTLLLAKKWNASPNQSKNAIWQSGTGPTVDTLKGNIFLVMADRFFEPNVGSYGQCAVQVDPQRTDAEGIMQVVDYYAPDVSFYTLDLGSTGVMFVPDTRLLIFGSKEGWLYMADADNMGHWDPDGSKIVQRVKATPDNIHGNAVYWKSSTTGENVYVWPESTAIIQYRLQVENEHKGTLTQVATGNTVLQLRDMPGGILTVSADGGKDGIVWASRAVGDAKDDVRPGVLHAYKADDVSTELWNSLLNAERDDVGPFPKFNPPTVVAGRVYLPNFSFGLSNQCRLNVYGLQQPIIVTPLPEKMSAELGQVLQITVAATGARPLKYTWYTHDANGRAILVDPPQNGKRDLFTDPIARDAVFWVEVSNPIGVVTSNKVQVIVGDGASINPGDSVPRGGRGTSDADRSHTIAVPALFIALSIIMVTVGL